MQAQEQSPYWLPPNAKPSPIVAQLQAGGSTFPGGQTSQPQNRCSSSHAVFVCLHIFLLEVLSAAELLGCYNRQGAEHYFKAFFCYI